MSSPVKLCKSFLTVYNVLVPISSVIIIIFPMLCRWKIDHSQSKLSLFPVEMAICSAKFEVAVSVGISVAIQLLVKLAFRFINKPSIIYCYKSGLSFLIYFLIMLAPQLIIILFIIPLYSIELLVAVIEIRNILLLCFIASFLDIYGKEVWRGIIFKSSYFLLALSSILSSYEIYASPGLFDRIQVGILCSQISGGFIFFVLSINYLNVTFRNYRLNNLTMDQCLCSNFAFFYSFLILATIIHSSINNYQSIVYYNIDSLVSYFYIFAFFFFFTFLCQSHLLLYYNVSTKSNLEIKRTFIRYISHEIRTPLNTVLMGLQYLQELHSKSSHNEDTLNVIDDIIVSCGLATKTLNDMLMHDTVEAGNLSIQKVTVNLSTLIDQTMKTFYVEATKKGITLAATYLDNTSNTTTNSNNTLNIIDNDCRSCSNASSSPHNIQVNVDPSRITQALHNLLANAMAHTPTNGSITFKVRKVAEMSVNGDGRWCSGGAVKIDIVDTGSGISLERQKDLFCGTIDFSPGLIQNITGSGLGLFISKGIIDAHHGVLSMYSEGVGKGCTFTIELPLDIKQGGNVTSLDQTEETFPPTTTTAAAEGDSFALEGQSHSSILTWMSASVQHVFIRKKNGSNDMNKKEKGIKIPHIYKSQSTRSYPESGTPSTRRSCFSNDRSSIIEIDPSSTDRRLSTSTYFQRQGRHSKRRRHYLEEEVEGDEEDFTERLEEAGISHSCAREYNREKELAAELEMQPESKSYDFTTTESQIQSVGNRLRVLVVDDVALNRKMLMRLLRDRYEVIGEAADGLDAVNQVRQAMSVNLPFDVITMDYQMPVMDGPTAVKQIREIGFKGCILGVTGNALPEDVNTFLEHGVNEVLIKPLNIHLFDKAIVSFIKQEDTDGPPL